MPRIRGSVAPDLGQTPAMRPVLTATALAVALPTALPVPAVSAPVAGDAHAIEAPASPPVHAERAGTSGYHHGATYTQILTDEPSRGVRATFTVHRPRRPAAVCVLASDRRQ